MRVLLPTLLVLLLACSGAAALAQDLLYPQTSSDPYVQLDEAKLAMAEGKLQTARDMLDRIDASGAEEYVQEELQFQRMLLDYAYLAATTQLVERLEQTGRGESEYAGWLRSEWMRYASRFRSSAGSFLKLTEERQDLEFVRFRLPTVSEQNLQDLELFADEMVLTAAVENWSEGKGGLGRALIISQARVALMLSAAVYYDMPQASESIARLQERLYAGVPIGKLTTLDWLSRSVLGLSPGWGLRELQETADRRIIALTSGREQSEWRRKAEERLRQSAAAEDERAEVPPANENGAGASE